MELIIMSAGMGSRFGGLKQIEPIDSDGNFIIDYSIFDAIKVGFDKIIFVIKKENYEIFQETIGKRISKKVKVSYVFQENNFKELSSLHRTKPLGTGQAVLICENEVSNKFGIINADDFYGHESFLKLKNTLEKLNDNEFCIALFSLKNTISNFGDVKRGIAYTKNGDLTKISECQVKKIQDKFLLTKLKSFDSENSCTSQDFTNIVSGDQPVSMNMFGANKKLFEFLKRDFEIFLSNKNNLETSELFLPTSITDAIKENKIIVKTFTTPSKWLGLTYKEDISQVKSQIKILKSQGIYPKHLWKN